MATHGEKSPIRYGLRAITVHEFCQNPLGITELIERKLQGLPIDAVKQPVFAAQIQDVARLLRAVTTRAYGQTSMLALLDILQALDYFLVLSDGKRDSEIGGYLDDAGILAKVFKKHEPELDEFRLWFNRHQQC